MVKIYTKTGDRGTTSIFGGDKVGKDAARINAYGHVDELNSQIGVILTEDLPSDVVSKLLRIQNELFILGTDLASPYSVKVKIPRVTKVLVNHLEKEIDIWTRELPQLRNFILPGGGKAGAMIHMARTIARRAERTIVNLSKTDKINVTAIIYINRLSDWLFTLARYVNKKQGAKEKIWQGRK